jgi:hypothetical protein
LNRICRELSQIPQSGRALPIILIFSFTLMGALFLIRWNSDLNFDGEIYISAARKIGEGMYRESLMIHRMPLYPFMISLVQNLVPNWVLAGRLISCLSMIFTVIPLYLLSKDLFNRSAAFWGSIAFTLLPETLLQSNSVLRDPPFFLFAISAVQFAQKALQSKRLTHLLISALLSWFSTHFRIEGFIIFPIYLCFLIALSICKKEQRKEYIRMSVAWTVFFALIVISIYFFLETQDININRYNDWAFFYYWFRDSSLLANYNLISDQIQQMQDSSLNSDIGQHFAGTVKQIMELIYFLGALNIFIKVILPVNMFALLWGLARAKYTERHFFVILIASCSFILACGYFFWRDILIPRYLFLPALLLFPWVGFGIERMFTIFKKRDFIMTCILVFVFAAPALKFDKYFLNNDDLKLRAGSWIAKNEILRNSKIIFSDPGVKFHAGMEMDFAFEENKILYQNPDDKYFSKIAQAAIEENADAIVIYSQQSRRNCIQDFSSFKEIKEHKSANKFIKIYISSNLLPSLQQSME